MPVTPVVPSMTPLPQAAILFVTADPDTEVYSGIVDQGHTVDIRSLTDPIDQHLRAEYDVLVVDDRHPDFGPRRREGTAPTREKLALITDTEPDPSVFDVGYDDYLLRPISRSAFETTVQGLLTRQRYLERVDERFEVAKQLARLEATAESDDLQTTPRYQALKTRLDALGSELDGLFDRLMTVDSHVAIFHDLQATDRQEPVVRGTAAVY